jgi:hypothetical protein
MELAPSRLHHVSISEAFTMRSFQSPADTRFYAGVDLHARSLFLVVLDPEGQTRFARNLPASAADNKPGRCGTAFPIAAVNPEPRPEKASPFQGGVRLFLG